MGVDSTSTSFGDCTLYLGDCRDILPTLDTIEAVVTDPPYGFEFNGTVGYAPGDMSDATLLADGNVFKTKGFKLLPVFRGMTLEQKQKLQQFHADWIALCRKALIISFAANKTLHLLISAADSCGYEVTDVALWHYKSGMRKKKTLYQPQYEPIAVLYGGKMRMDSQGIGGNILFFPKPAAKNGHPTKKPVELMAELVRIVPAATIVDPFMGSGATGIAALQAGRKFIGIERDPKYFEIARATLLAQVSDRAESSAS